MEDYIKRILKVLVYIESHLEDTISVEDLAKVACYSSFHFHRIFQLVVGETAHHYVKRLRLERAASRLAHSQQPITQIALETNYETPSAFTRAFKHFLGESPKNYRLFHKEIHRMEKKLQNLPIIQPDSIDKITDLSVLFIRKSGPYESSSEDAWTAMRKFIDDQHLNHHGKLRYFSIAHDNPMITSEEKLRFDACIYTPDPIQPQAEIGRQILKKGRYAVFTHDGPHSDLDPFFDRIVFKWLPASGETFDESRVSFCEHFNLEYVDSDPAKLITKIYFPLQ